MSRYAKYSGATTLEPRAPETPFRRFKPDFYIPAKELPSRNPKFGGGAQVRRFGRFRPEPPRRLRIPGLPLAGGLAGFGLGLVLDYDWLRNPYKPKLPDPNYWRLYNKCKNPPLASPPGTGVFGWNKTDTRAYVCISGQSGSLLDLDALVGGFERTYWQQYYVGGGPTTRNRQREAWHRYKTDPTGHSSVPYVWPVPATDPNDDRAAPGPSPDPAGDYHGPSGLPPGGISTRPPRTGQRPRNPPKRTRERKAKGPLQTVLRVADFISESAELVGAFYDALPKKTKEKWGCDKLKRGLIDSAGQYGIDGADCKLQALWHNWHKVDIDQAIKNAIANEIQDRILGGLQRGVPVNTGRTTDDAMKEINEWIGAFNEWLGL